MHLTNRIILLTIIISCVGCGGGGGRYYRLETPINNIGVKQVKLCDTSNNEYEKQFFPVAYEEREKSSAVIEKSREVFDGYEVYFREVKFNNIDYYVKESRSFSIITFEPSIQIIKKSDMSVVGGVRTPRSVSEFATFPMKFNHQEYLVIYVEQRATSHSSTLFILDSNFNVVYQNHLLGAEEIGFGNTNEYGNYFVIKSEDFWFPNGHDVPNPRVNINGDWLYYLPASD